MLIVAIINYVYNNKLDNFTIDSLFIYIDNFFCHYVDSIKKRIRNNSIIIFKN